MGLVIAGLDAHSWVIVGNLYAKLLKYSHAGLFLLAANPSLLDHLRSLITDGVTTQPSIMQALQPIRGGISRLIFGIYKQGDDAKYAVLATPDVSAQTIPGG